MIIKMNSDKTLIIDLETTGVNVHNDRICQIGAILPGGEEFETLVNPLRAIPHEATAIHGISDDMVATAPKFEDLADKVIRILEKTKYFVAYNFLFDFQMLQTELYNTVEYVLDEDDFIFIDPYRIHKTMFPNTLKNVFKFYTNEDFNDAHHAMHDAKATQRILIEQQKKYADLFSKPYEEVSEMTVGKVGILGKWFDIDQNNQIIFRQGKHKGEIVGPEHDSYLRWILGLDDTTISERRYITKTIGTAQVR